MDLWELPPINPSKLYSASNFAESVFWLPARTRIDYLSIINHSYFNMQNFLHTPKYAPQMLKKWIFLHPL